MWNLGDEKRVQLELVASNIDNIDDEINFIYSRFLPNGEFIDGNSTIDKLYDLLINSLLYGVSERDLILECPHCKKVLNLLIDIKSCIKYESGGCINIGNQDINDFLKSEKNQGYLNLRKEYDCQYCKKKILFFMDEAKILENYIFNFDLTQFYQLVLFFKEFGFSINEIENLTLIECQLLQTLCKEQIEAKNKALRDAKGQVNLMDVLNGFGAK